MKAEIVAAMQTHIPYLAEGVREADKNEIWASFMLSPFDALNLSLSVSTKSWTGLVDGEPICMFGVAPTTILCGDSGRPWMIGTDLLDKFAMVFLKRCKTVVQEMNDIFPTLENYVDCRNVRAIRWLKWLGFQFDEPAPYGVMQLPFMRFWMIR